MTNRYQKKPFPYFQSIKRICISQVADNCMIEFEGDPADRMCPACKAFARTAL